MDEICLPDNKEMSHDLLPTVGDVYGHIASLHESGATYRDAISQTTDLIVAIWDRSSVPHWQRSSVRNKVSALADAFRTIRKRPNSRKRAEISI